MRTHGSAWPIGGLRVLLCVALLASLSMAAALAGPPECTGKNKNDPGCEEYKGSGKSTPLDIVLRDGDADNVQSDRRGRYRHKEDKVRAYLGGFVQPNLAGITLNTGQGVKPPKQRLLWIDASTCTNSILGGDCVEGVCGCDLLPAQLNESLAFIPGSLSVRPYYDQPPVPGMEPDEERFMTFRIGARPPDLAFGERWLIELADRFGDPGDQFTGALCPVIGIPHNVRVVAGPDGDLEPDGEPDYWYVETTGESTATICTNRGCDEGMCTLVGTVDLELALTATPLD